MYNLVKVKEEMIVRAPKKLKEMARLDCRQQQDYMSQVSLYDSRLDFRYQSNILDSGHPDHDGQHVQAEGLPPLQGGAGGRGGGVPQAHPGGLRGLQRATIKSA